MTTKTKLARKKPKSVTPILFKIDKEKQEAIKKPPHVSLNRIKAGTGDATDWFNVAFRIRVGLHIARTDYTQETVDGVMQAFTLCDLIYCNAKKEKGPDWTITADQAEVLEDALCAVDTMQDETTRRIQLDAHLQAKKLMHEYVTGFEEYVSKVNKCNAAS